MTRVRLSMLVALLALSRPASAGTPAHPTTETTEPKTGSKVVTLPAGTFRFGCEPQDTACGDNERPARDVKVESFKLMQTAVTVAAYAKCAQAGACKEFFAGGRCNWSVKGRQMHPMNCVTWTEAKTFCAWVGGRLPTPEEWEFAAKGGGSRIYPWGDAPVSGRRANFCDKRCKHAHADYPWADPREDDGWAETSPAGSHPRGATAQGLLDMAGNVSQWISNLDDHHLKEVRGGSWGDEARALRASHRQWFAEDDHLDGLGLRCAF